MLDRDLRKKSLGPKSYYQQLDHQLNRNAYSDCIEAVMGKER